MCDTVTKFESLSAILRGIRTSAKCSRIVFTEIPNCHEYCGSYFRSCDIIRMLPHTVLWRKCGPADREPHRVLPLLLMQHSLPRRYTFGFCFGVDVSTTATRQCLRSVKTVFGVCHHQPGSSLNFTPWINTDRKIFLKHFSSVYSPNLWQYGSWDNCLYIPTHIICMVPDSSPSTRVIQVKLLPNSILTALYLRILGARIN